MLRYFCWTTALSVVLTPLMTKVALSLPLATGSQLSGVQSNQNSSIDVPLCYIQTADGRVVDLQQLCSSNQNPPLASTSSSEVVSGTRRGRIRAGGYAGDKTGGEEDSRSD